MRHIRTVLLGTALLAALGSALPLQAEELSPLLAALEGSRPILDARLRYENVSQLPLAREADAMTLRARFGVQTGKAWETSLLVEGEALVPLSTDYNSTVNGHTQYPVVADPESYALNRLALVNTALPGTTLTLGRQRILLDDQRFVGNSGWRQNEQTFDALRMVNKSVAGLTIDLTYVNQVNRVYGPEGLPGANTGRYHGGDELANVAWQTPFGKLSGFAYLVSLQEAPKDSTQTYGLRFAGERALGVLRIGYVVSAATQRAYRDNPLSFSNDYALAEVTGSLQGFSLGAGYERLGGNGVKGFTTPLATLHRFQGWADKFLVTPSNGLDDSYITAGYQAKAVGPLQQLALSLAWHQYESDRLAINYGQEMDLQLQARHGRFTETLKLADYSAAFTTPLTQRDTRKLWAQVEFTW